MNTPISIDEQVVAIKAMAKEYQGLLRIYKTSQNTMMAVLGHGGDASGLLYQLRHGGWLQISMRKGQYTPMWYVYVRLNQEAGHV